ncbi:N-acetylmuramoyl-L-alanine amidase [Salisediminibacterium beveridgei]|uniref:N-acetylmuramoyl-L-alanine amidase n=1 Tax=Salisediminibacterium beveridgei TaxID=632773 RepID=A0A1D7QRS4_9BACI|nr:N-acetylmuramoyl-L-alanine amidase [Salisediminibacterium beveridgei]AOM81699.1 N-acetylmuramoyl-L-alanine amidase [Salisediminibacterium beveridgei]
MEIIKRMTLWMSVVAIVFGLTVYFSESTYAEFNYERVAGQNRVDTSVEISKAAFPDGIDSSEKAVIIARADNPADALASASLASAKDAPILLTSSSILSASVKDELQRLGAEKAYVLGGPVAIENSVISDLEDHVSVERIAGDNRFATAEKINRISSGNDPEKAIIVNGITVADALSASGVSSNFDYPVYLAQQDRFQSDLPDSVNEVYLFGGEVAIADNVASDLESKGLRVTRIAGDDRFETNVAVNQAFDFSGDKSILVRGTSTSSDHEDYPDAVASAGLSHKMNAPVVLTLPDRTTSSTSSYLETRRGTTFILGGEVAVSSSVLHQLSGVDNANAKVITSGSTLNVRSSSNSSSSIQDKLEHGTLIEILDTISSSGSDSWHHIRYSGGKTGYIHGSYAHFLPKSSASSGPLAGRTIVIDAGHGAHDAGGIGGGMREKDVVIDISLRAEDVLREAGASVIMIRRDDIFLSLRQRASVANLSGADAFLSVHTNMSGPTQGKGTETFWHDKYSARESERLAHAIQNATVQKMGTRNRGVKSGNFHVIRETKIPSALLEVGFKDYEPDAEKLRQASYRQKSAEAIRDGFIEYYRR